MCGFVTIFSTTNLMYPIQDMLDVIEHRGPDAEGIFTDEQITLGFKRLSIIDEKGGNQPFSDETKRFNMVFNGEIYNYLELRETLVNQGVTFLTSSDTEVLLQAYLYYKEDVVNHLRGMYAFVIYDSETNELFGARDHFGIKPLFYWENGKDLVFASEQKSIKMAMGDMSVNKEALSYYASYQYSPNPFTLTNGIISVKPGHSFSVKDGELTFNRYFSTTYQPKPQMIDDASQEILRVMRDSVEKHMRSDVPVGCFLSGGIDSTATTALACELHPGIKAFTVGFERDGYSEFDGARESAVALGVEHIERVITVEEYMEALPKIIWHLDDPIADPALVPLYFVAEEARKHVTVVLSGEGADELFGGYKIYGEAKSIAPISNLPISLRRALRTLANLIPEGVKGKSYLIRGTTDIRDRYIGNANMFTEHEKQLLLKHFSSDYRYTNITHPIYEELDSYDDVTKMMGIDMHTWLVGDILVKADRMTMAHSLELRVPFLDKEVFEVARTLPTSLRLAKGTTKYALREAMKSVIPSSALTAPKLGFPVPIKHWLKNEMYGWALDIFNRSEAGDYIELSYVKKLLEDHRAGKGEYGRKIWTVLVFCLWYEAQFTNASKKTDLVFA